MATKNPATGKPLGKTPVKPVNPPAPKNTPNINANRAVAVPQGKGIITPFGARKPLLKPDIQGCNYVQFLNTKSRNYADMLAALKVKAKDWVDDSPILHTVNGPVILDPFQYVMTSQFFQHFSETDDSYNILSSVMDVDQAPGGSFNEFVEALIIVVADGKVFPATASFKKTKVAAFHTLDTYIQEGRIDASEDGMYLGALATYTMSDYTSKSTRREMVIGDCTVDETPKDVQALIKKAFGTPAFLADLQKCVNAMKARYQLVESKQVS